MSAPTSGSVETELAKERTFGGEGVDVDREIPRPGGFDGHRLGPRCSIAYFAQADRDAVIESPSRTHASIIAADYLEQRLAANFAG